MEKRKDERLDRDRDLRLANLLAAAQRGDREAYASFLTEVSALLRGYLIRRIGNSDAAEDVLQEILITVHQARNTYQPGRPVGPWLFAIAEHRTSDHFRHNRRQEVALPDDAVEPEPAGDERSEVVRAALTRLPETQRRVIEMLKVEDLSVREVAERTGMSESSVKVTAFRGYEAIRRILGVKRESKLTT